MSEPRSFLRTAFGENDPQVSPNGRYLAYQSDESGRYEVYVRPFPEGAGKWQISTNGGAEPRWSRAGNELFYRTRGTVPGGGGQAVMSAPVSSGPGFTSGTPQRLFETEDLRGQSSYSVLSNGGFVMVRDEEGNQADAGQPTIRIVENWYEEFRDREE